MRKVLFAAVAVAGALAACRSTPDATAPQPPHKETEARVLYPDLAALYAADAGIYRSCAANQGVCHNDKEHPNLATLGAVVMSARSRCNLGKEKAADLHDLCEPPGDTLMFEGERVEVGWMRGTERYDRVEVKLRSMPKTWRGKATLMRGSKKLALFSVEKTLEPRHMLLKPLPSEDIAADIYGDEYDAYGGVRMGDANDNGIFGAELGGGTLVVPGHPEKSYLMTRLTDPSAGPLMPRANCCAWTKASLRALFCWISGLKDNFSNALDPIDYAKCPPGPKEDVLYPEPGPACETSGMCPVKPRIALSSDASWNAVKQVLESSCAGGACHNEQGSGFFLGEAYKTALDRVIPFAPDRSDLYLRITPGQCEKRGCMPLHKPALEPGARDLIRRWIARGAPRD
jgi:hypothetical protein